MSSMIGADVPALRELGRTLARGGDQLREATTQLTGELGRVNWLGRDAEDFRRQWSGSLSGLLRVAAARLIDAGGELQRQADQQDRASAADGSGPVVVGVAGPGLSLGLLGRHGRDDPFPASPDDPNAPVSSNGYQIGPPRPPELSWDEDYVYASQQPTAGDRWDYAQWRLKGEAAQLVWDDGAQMYLHYLGNSGEDLHYDLAEGYREDEGVAAVVNREISRAAQGIDELVASSGQTQFQVTGPASSSAPHYPVTENWQKAIGGHQQWSSADVTVENGVVTMEITVHAEDRYNFNRGQADIGSGTPDDVNGRFTEVGLAQPFNSHGTMTQTVTWPVGQPPAEATVAEQVTTR